MMIRRAQKNTGRHWQAMVGEGLPYTLHLICERGYAIDNAGNFDRLACIGATIFGPDDRAIGAIIITFPTKRFEEKYASAVPTLRQACIGISGTMGATAVSLIKLASYD